MGAFFQKMHLWHAFFAFTDIQPLLHARNAVHTAFLAGLYKSYRHVTSPMPDCFAQNAACAAILRTQEEELALVNII